jgi:hypothetical protein
MTKNKKCNVLNHFNKAIRKQKIDANAIQELLPCSINDIDNLEEIYIEGQNILKNEIDNARHIPERERKLLNKKAVNIGLVEREETFVENYDT